MALTDIEIRKARVSSKTYRLSDGGGLHLLVTPAGGKLWRWKYRVGGREKLMSFGRYPDVPLALARVRHAEARRLLATGADPMAERKAEKAAAATSFKALLAPVGTLAGWEECAPRSSGEASPGKQYLSPQGARPIAAIEAPELVAMTKAIERRARRTLPNVHWKPQGRFFDPPSRTDMRGAIQPARFAPSDIFEIDAQAEHAP